MKKNSRWGKFRANTVSFGEPLINFQACEGICHRVKLLLKFRIKLPRLKSWCHCESWVKEERRRGGRFSHVSQRFTSNCPGVPRWCITSAAHCHIWAACDHKRSPEECQTFTPKIDWTRNCNSCTVDVRRVWDSARAPPWVREGRICFRRHIRPLENTHSPFLLSFPEWCFR